MLKNKQNTHYPRFIFTIKPGEELPETGVLVSLCGPNKADDPDLTKSLFLPNSLQETVIPPSGVRIYDLLLLGEA